MTARRSDTRLLVHAEKPRTLAERGAMYYAEDVQKLLGNKPGKAEQPPRPRRSLWWIIRHFAPKKRQMLGRTVYWWEADVLAELDAESRRRQGAA